MMQHLAALLGDKHAKDRNEWLTGHSDELLNYTHSNCGITELKVTNESPDPRKSNVLYLGSFI